MCGSRGPLRAKPVSHGCPGAARVFHGSLGAEHSLTVGMSPPEQMLGSDARFQGLRRAYSWRGQSAMSRFIPGWSGSAKSFLEVDGEGREINPQTAVVPSS